MLLKILWNTYEFTRFEQIKFTNVLLDWYDIFNGGHVLQLRLDIATVRKRMNIILDDYNSEMILRDECGLNFPTFLIQLSKTLN